MTASHGFSAAQLVGLTPTSISPQSALSVQQFLSLPPRPPTSVQSVAAASSPEAAMVAAAAAAAAATQLGRQQQQLQHASPATPPSSAPGGQVPPPPLPPPSWAYGHPALLPVDPQTESFAENWRQFQQAAYNYNLDPHILAMYGGGGGFGHHHHHHHPRAGDLSARRKNATRETTSILKAWLNEHKKNPYPTKGEKIMLAIITTMTLTQVSTWFANARRRLKKENKMTWVPRNRAEEEDEEDDVGARATNGNGIGGGGAAASDDRDHAGANDFDEPDDGLDDIDVESAETPPPLQNAASHQQLLRKRPFDGGCQQAEQDEAEIAPAAKAKPRIWSIVETLNKSEPAPPPPPLSQLSQRHHPQPPPLQPQPPLQHIPPHHPHNQLHHHHHNHHNHQLSQQQQQTGPLSTIPLGFFPHPPHAQPPPPPFLLPPPPLYYSLFSAFNRPLAAPAPPLLSPPLPPPPPPKAGSPPTSAEQQKQQHFA